MMGIMMPETCRDRSLIINIGFVASCWFISLQPTFRDARSQEPKTYKHTLGHRSQQHCSHFSIKHTQQKHRRHFSVSTCFRYISPRHYYWTLSTILSISDKLIHDVSGIRSTSVFMWLVIILTNVLCPFLNSLGGDCN